jgi:hypothetical protein
MSETATPQAAEATPKAVEQMVKFKFNHEDKEEPFDVNTYQKGKNYDKMQERLDGNETQLKEVAAKLKTYEQAEEQRKMTKQAVDLAEKDGITPEIAQQLVEAQQRASNAEAKNTNLEADKVINNQIQSFMKARPDINLATIPDEVLETAKRTGDLLVAYQAFEAEGYKARVSELEKEVSVKKVNDDNSASSMGSASSDGDAVPTEFTKESVDKMPRAQRRKLFNMPDSPLLKWINEQHTKK